MNEKHEHSPINRKLLKWLLGCFVAVIAVAVLLASLVVIAFFGILTFGFHNHTHQSVRIVDVNASNGLIFSHSPEILERYQSSWFLGLLPFENFSIEIVIEGAGAQKEYHYCKLNRRGIAGLFSPDACSLALAVGGLSCTCYS